MIKDTICVAVGLVGGFFTAIFGGWDSALVTLVVFMAIDFFTGIITAMMKKSKHTESGGLSSKAGWFGLAKKVCTLMLIVVAVRMDILLNTNYIRDAVCISFCLNELLSIVENTSLMGIPYPPAIQKAIDVLQTKIGRTEETTDKEDKQYGYFKTRCNNDIWRCHRQRIFTHQTQSQPH